MEKKEERRKRILPPIEEMVPQNIPKYVNEALKRVISPSPSRLHKLSQPLKNPKITATASATVPKIPDTTLTKTVKTTVPKTLNTTLSTIPSTTVDKKTLPQSKPSQRSEKTFVTLDSTHTKSEAIIYSLMYRETISKGMKESYFSIRKLMKMSGIGSDRTVSRALQGLQEKRSIILVQESNHNPTGTLFRMFTPKEIIAERKRVMMEIDPCTKKIRTTTVGTTLPTTVGVAKTATVGVVENTTVSVVKTATVNDNTPYINKNINNDDSIKDIESSSKSSSNKEDDTDDDIFNHRVYVISLYEKYTGNQWRVGDDEFYESENLKGILPEVIEAAIIASVLRSKTKVNSFAYCKGAIEEFQESLSPGYLSYLRKEYRKATSKEIERKEDIKNETTSFLLTLPRDSYFEEGWLKNYISGFPKEEQAKIKRLAERFDHFMLTAGEKKEWVKNPTGTFIGLVRGEVNVPIAKRAPTFEERLEEERRIEEEEKIREQERLEWEREREKQEQRKGQIEKAIKEAISQLWDEDLRRFITGARKKYGVKALESDESVLQRVPYLIIHELYERGEQDWRKIWDSIYKAE